jgi:preprotein translocase subunit SecG
MNILINILLVIYVLVALLMILVILMQRPKSEGLGAAFGGGVTENIFGAQTTNVLTKFTGWLAGIFFVLTFSLSILYAHRVASQSALRSELMKTQPVAPASPAPGTAVSPGAAASALPSAQPGPSSAVGPPGTVTNPTPASAGPSASVKPADMAVGAVPAAGTQPQQSPPPPPKKP